MNEIDTITIMLKIACVVLFGIFIILVAPVIREEFQNWLNAKFPKPFNRRKGDHNA